MATILLIMILCVSNIFIVKVKAQENNKEAIILQIIILQSVWICYQNYKWTIQ